MSPQMHLIDLPAQPPVIPLEMSAKQRLQRQVLMYIQRFCSRMHLGVTAGQWKTATGLPRKNPQPPHLRKAQGEQWMPS